MSRNVTQLMNKYAILCKNSNAELFRTLLMNNNAAPSMSSNAQLLMNKSVTQ